ncbi:MAG: hypothetical protein AB7R89_16195 [Dehalococcoidia bacterium]
MRTPDLARLAAGAILIVALVVIGTRTYVDVRDAPVAIEGTLYLRALVQVAVVGGVIGGIVMAIHAFDS